MIIEVTRSFIEVIEEVGFDIRSRIREDQFLENERNGQIIRLYIIANVPLDTKFLCKTKNEIKVCWSFMRSFTSADLGYPLVSHR